VSRQREPSVVLSPRSTELTAVPISVVLMGLLPQHLVGLVRILERLLEMRTRPWQGG
jgi:hypothetical protein